MKRRLFSVTAGVSFALFLVTAAVWGRSLGRYESVSYGRWNVGARRYTILEIMWGDGRIALSHTFIEIDPDRGGLTSFAMPTLGWVHDVQPYMSFNPYGELSDTFDWWLCAKEPSINPNLGTGFSRMIGVRFWPIILLSAILPAMWVRTRPRRRVAGRCPTCGYDLRATPDRCPECGRRERTVHAGRRGEAGAA